MALGGLAACLGAAAQRAARHRFLDLPDVPLVSAPMPDHPRIVALGTSLTSRGTWPAAVAARLQQDLGRGVELSVDARPGATSSWGETRIQAVRDAKPDAVLVEFAINDADYLDGLSLAASRRAMAAILSGLAEEAPNRRILVLSMNPTTGLRGAVRPRLTAYRRAHRDLILTGLGAEVRASIGWLNLTQRWSWEISSTDLPDGLHPTAEAATRIQASPIAAALSTAWRGPRS